MATAVALKHESPPLLPVPRKPRAKRGEDPFVALLAHYQTVLAWSAAASKAGYLDTDEGFDYFTGPCCQASSKITNTPGSTAFAAYAKLYCFVRGRRFNDDLSDLDSLEPVSAFNTLAALLGLPDWEACRPRGSK